MVGLLLITHNNVGGAVFDAATSVLGNCPLPFEILPISQSCNPDARLKKAQEYIENLQHPDGVLVITDIYGSTPSNIATKLKAENVTVVTGLNLPMLLRVMNYPKLPLNELAEKALDGGQTGVILV